MNLTQRLRHWATTSPHAPALVFEGETITFHELQSRSQTTAQLLAMKYGVKRGDRVAFLGLNHPNILYLVYACAHVGAIFSPWNSRLARDEYAYLVDNCEPVICFYDDHFSDTVAALTNANCQFVHTSTLDHNEQGSDCPAADVAQDDALLLVYTSGTTGKPKGVLLSRSAVDANIENGNALYGFLPGQNVLITLPLFHVGGLCILLLPALTNGATIYLHAKFDPGETLNALQRDRIITSIFVPAQMSAMMGLEGWQDARFDAMKYVVMGSSIVPMNQTKAWHDKGIPLSQVYGATETGPTAIAMPVAHAVQAEGSAGSPAHLCEIDIRDAQGASCRTGVNGEIWVSGPNILSCYWRNHNETDKVLQNGWYNTGDIGHVDANGFYWIVDRSKDVIISGGENIYPAEIEAVALDHPAINAIAIVGRSDLHWGETPVAAVELAPGASLEIEELTAFFKDRIARFKQPKAVITFTNLPRNSMGKIDKTAIRKAVNS